jgi:hypothetical protein
MDGWQLWCVPFAHFSHAMLEHFNPPLCRPAQLAVHCAITPRALVEERAQHRPTNAME